MSDLEKRLRQLTPEQRERLKQRLQDKRGPRASVGPSITRRAPAAAARLSAAQQRLWFFEQLSPGTSNYNNPIALRLRGRLDVPALGRALEGVLARHEALRTRFDSEDGRPVQRVAAPGALPLPVVDLRARAAGEREDEALRLAEAEVRRPFDLRNGPLLRGLLVRLDDDDQLLVVTIHHIVSDGWSMGVLVHEVTAFYEHLVLGRPLALPELPIQYADFAEWEHAALQGPALEGELAYWTRQLAGPPPPLDLPLARPRPPVQSFRGASRSVALPRELAARLQALSERAGATLFMTLLAALVALFHRYTGQDDLVVGTPIAGRTRPETHGLIGFFLNSLALRTSAAGDPTFLELLARVRRTALEAFDHQDVPFARVVDALQPPRDRSRNPIFQVMFILQNAPMGRLELPGLSAERRTMDIGAANLDLTLALERGPAGLTGWLEYSTALFDDATIERIFGHYAVLLEGVVADPECRLSRLPLLTAPEREQLLRGWSRGARAVPTDGRVEALFERRADATPDAVALIAGDARVTYGELEARANRLAHHLRELGARPEVPVGVCLERSVEAVVALLAVLKAGAAFVPLDPEYPAQRLAAMLRDSGAPLLVTAERRRAMHAASGARVVSIDGDDRRAIERASSARPAWKLPDGHALAYVIYTSGSTGTPKGVLGEHRGVVNRCRWMAAEYPFAPGEVHYHRTPLSFVDAVWELFVPLVEGVPSVIAPAQTGADPWRLLDEIERHGVTRAVFPPALLRALLETDLDLARRARSVRYWMSSGEELPVALLQLFRARVPGARLLNLYGASEVSPDAATGDVTDDAHGPRVPIGRAISNMRVYVLSGATELVPQGVPGEIYAAGAGVARGYLRRAGLTAERFVPDPFSPEPGGRLYRLGDLGRYLADGTLEYLGRVDHQVKIRGHRVEPGEVEAVIRQGDAVGDVAVVAPVDARSERLLVAYVVAAPGASLDLSRLRSFARERLSPAMVPTRWTVLDALPKTPNGKIDRRALVARPLDDEPGAAPPPTLERRADVAQWFYAPRWERAPSSPASRAATHAGSWLLFADRCGLGERLARELDEQSGGAAPVVVVRPGNEFARVAPRVFTVRPAHGEDYVRLLGELGGARPGAIVHLWGVTAAGESHAPPHGQDLGFYSVVALARALGQQRATQRVELRVVTSGMQPVDGEAPTDPAKATLLGPCRVIPQEDGSIAVQSIDLPPADGAADWLATAARALLDELARTADEEPVVAYRAGQRWVRRVLPVPLPRPEPAALPLRSRGTYLITGGLGGIGLAVADYLARRFEANLVLVGRTALPPPEARPAWLAAHPEADRTSRAIRAVERLEAAGATVLTAAADVTDRARLGAVLREARARFGRIDGVVHAAGVHVAGTIQRDAGEGAAAALAPKLTGTLVLDELLAADPPDWLVLCSSAGSILGGFAGAAYCAANAFLDAFAHAACGRTRTVAIDWDAWREVGMAAEADVRPELRALLERSLSAGITSDEGVDAFARALASGLPQLVVCTRDFEELFRRPYFLPGVGSSAELDASLGAQHRRSRPALKTPFVPPRDEFERAVARVWEELLGVEPVGAADDFFELGGHSLVATRVVARLRERLGVNIPVASVFQQPTVEGLSRLLVAARAAAPDGEREEIEI